MSDERVEVWWYVAAHPVDAGHAPVIGDTKWSLMYWDFGRGVWERDPHYATQFCSKQGAETAALTLVATHPHYLGKLRVKRWRYAWHPAPPPPNA